MKEDIDVNAIANRTVNTVLGVVTVGALFAILTNVIALVSWEADSFQRLGSLWVAVLILIFGFGRMMVNGLGALFEDPAELSTFTFAGNDNSFVKRFAPSDEAVEILVDASSRQQARQLLRLIENRMTVLVLPSELFWLAVATLQWGYGDLFHCWINGKGWTTC